MKSQGKKKVTIPIISISSESTPKASKPHKGKEKRKVVKKKFNSNSDYYITLTDVIYQIQRGDYKHVDLTKTYELSSDFVRVKRHCPPVTEYHEGVKAKFIACVVNKHLEFSKIEKRGVKIASYGEEKFVYYIPIYYICSLLPTKFSKNENIGNELSEIPIFKYTGNIECFDCLNIFNLATSIYLTKKSSLGDKRIHVLL